MYTSTSNSYAPVNSTLKKLGIDPYTILLYGNAYWRRDFINKMYHIGVSSLLLYRSTMMNNYSSCPIVGLTVSFCLEIMYYYYF